MKYFSSAESQSFNKLQKHQSRFRLRSQNRSCWETVDTCWSFLTCSSALFVTWWCHCVSQENACARCLLKTCICCLWCLEKCLNYLNQVTNLFPSYKMLVFFSSSRLCLCFPECLCSHSHQQHQFLHFCTRRLCDPGGERSACRHNQRRWRLRALLGEGETAAQSGCDWRPNRSELVLVPVTQED